jgi:flagellar hook-basal body complex protein FliE
MDFASAVSKVIPGTFVPDIAGSSNDVPNIAPIPGVTQPNESVDNGGTSFKDTVKKMLGDVNDKLNTSDQLSQDLASGKESDVEKVVTSNEEANLALQFAMSIRTKVLDAYTEVSRMTV